MKGRGLYLCLSARMHQVYETRRAVGTQGNADKAKQTMASSSFPCSLVIIEGG